jgi:hypothetical protein
VANVIAAKTTDTASKVIGSSGETPKKKLAEAAWRRWRPRSRSRAQFLIRAEYLSMARTMSDWLSLSAIRSPISRVRCEITHESTP